MIKQTTLHNILTWVIAVILFIFQSLNYFIAWIKKYVKHGQKTTTVVTADTTISSESNLNNKNVPENVKTVQGLIQKHFDIPLIIAEDEPKVYNFIKSAQLLTSNEICKEKTKIDQFMENLVDDSYVARGLGLITATVGRQSEFYLYSKYDNNFENIVIMLNGRNGEIGQITILNKNPANIVELNSIPMDYIYDKDRIKVTYTPFAEGVYTLTLVRNSLSIGRSPYYISVEKSPTNSRSQIRLGTKKYKPVTKYAKAKHSSLEISENSIPVIEPGKPSICRNILPESEKNSIRTDVMSIVTKFESNSINAQKRIHKRTSSISEKGSENDSVDEIATYSNIPLKVETPNVHDTYVCDLNSPSIHSKTKATDKNFQNDVDITYKNSKASDINVIDFESDRIKEPITKLNEYIAITQDIPGIKNVSSTHSKPTNSVLVENLKIVNSHDVEKHNQTFKTIELMDQNKHIEKLLEPTTRIDEIKCVDNEPCIQNEVSCFDDDDRKTVVVMEDSNEIESNLNDTAIQQFTDSVQYNINTPFASVITKITNSICEKCSIQVLKIISEFPKNINITHKNNSNEMSSSFETLLAQPISININIDNMFEQTISALNEQDSERLLTTSPTKIKHIDTTDKDTKCRYLNEIEPIDNNSDELRGDINNMSKELMIKQNKHNSKINKTIKDEIFDNLIVPLTKHNIDKNKTVHQNNELSTNEIMKIKYSTTNEENALHSNQFNNNIIHKSENKVEIQRQLLQKSSEHSMNLLKTNQFHENINKELNHISKESDKPLDTSDLVTINYDKNTNCELVTNEFKINNVIIPDENTNIESSVINNIALASVEVPLATSEYKSEDNEEQTNNITYKNVTSTSIQNENQKLMIEKSIEPILTSFKNKMVEKITQLYMNRDLSNTDNTSISEPHDKHLTNNLQEIQINKNTDSTEINTECIETLTSQLKNHIDKNEISEIILDQQKTNNNHLFKYVENIIKTNINPSTSYAQTLGEKKLLTLVNTAMNHPNNQQIDNDFKKMIIENKTQNFNLKKINNDEIVQGIDAMLVETPSITIIKNTDELISSKNEVTVITQCQIPLIHDFDTIEIENTDTDTDTKQSITTVENNSMEIKALNNFQKSHNNTETITPIIEFRPTLETQITNNLELGTVEGHSSKEIQTTIEVIDSINMPEETDVVENIYDESVKLQIEEKKKNKILHLIEKETINEIEAQITNNSELGTVEEHSSKKIQTTIKVIDSINIPEETHVVENIYDESVKLQIDKKKIKKIPHILVEKESINEVEENITTNTSTKSNSTENVSTQLTKKQEIELPGLKRVCDANNVTVESDIKYKLPPLNIAENIVLDKPNPQIIPTLNAQVSKNSAKVTIEINTSDPQFSNINITVLIPSKIPIIEENSTIPKLRIVNTLNKLNAIEILTIPNYSATCDTKKATLELQNASESTLSPNLCMKNRKLEKIENIDETLIPNDTDIKTLECLNSYKKIKSISPFANYTLSETTEESKTEKNTLHKTLNLKYKTTTLEPTVNEINCNNTKNETTKPISSSCGEEMENPIKKHKEIESMLPTDSYSEPNKKADEMLICTEAETPTFIDTSTSSLVRKISVEFVTNTIITPIKSLEIIVHEQIEKNIVTVRETTSTMNSLVEVMDEQVNIKNDGSYIFYVNSDDNVTNTETKTQKLINQNNAEKIIEIESPVPLNTLTGVVMEKAKVNIVTVTPITSCTNSSTVTVDVRTDVENVIEEKPPSPINSLGELVQKNMNMNINTENKTLLPIDKINRFEEEKKEKDELIQTLLPTKSTMESTKAPKIVDDIIETEILSYTKSSTKINNHQNHEEKIVNEVAIYSIGEVVGENMNMNIITESETLLSVGSTEESMGESKVEEDIPETTITPHTDFSPLTKDTQTDIEKSTAPNNSIGEVIVLNIDTENKTLLQIDKINGSEQEKKEKDGFIQTLLPTKSTMESTKGPQVVENITGTDIISCTESSTKIIYYQDHAEKKLEQEPLLVSINFSERGVDEKSKVIIDTENETHLPIVSTMESIDNPKEVESIIETKIKYCTEFSTKIIDMQLDRDNLIIVEPYPTPINYLGEVVGEITKENINSESETLLSITNYMEEKEVIEETSEIVLPIESAVEFIQEPKLEEDITEKKITSCIDSSTAVIQMDIEKVIGEESSAPNNSFGEVVVENTNAKIDKENEILLLIDATTESIEEKKEKDGLIDYLLTMKSTLESVEEPKVFEGDITEIEIISSTDSSSEIVETKIDVEKEMPPIPINSSGKTDGEKMKVNMDTEYENILLIESTIESIAETEIDEDTTKTEIISCTNSSTSTVHVQTDVEKVIEEVSLAQINFSDKKVGEKSKVNIDTENETLLPIELTIKSIAVPKTAEDIMKNEISSCSCILTMDAQRHIEEGLDSPESIDSSENLVAKKTNMNIDTGNETKLPIRTFTGPVEVRKSIEGTTEIALPIKSTIEFKEEPKVMDDITLTKITSCADSSFVIVETKIDVEKVIEEVSPVLNYSSGKRIREMTVDMDTEYENILLIESTIESIAETKIDEDTTKTEIISCTDSSTATVHVQTYVENVIEEVSLKPINFSDEKVSGKSKVNIDIENETILPIKTSTGSVEVRKVKEGTNEIELSIESNMELKEEPKVMEDITVTEKTLCTNSSSLIEETKIDVEKVIEEVPPILINSSGKTVGEKIKVNMDIEYENILLIKSTIESISETEIDEDKTKTEIVSFTDSSTSTVHVQTDGEKAIEEVYLAQINFSDEKVGEKSKLNINTEETFLTILSIEETKVEPTVVTETEILSCAESSTLIVNHQNHSEKCVEEVPINYLGEVIGENTNVNIVTENETLLPFKSTMESVENSKLIKDLTAITEIRSLTDSSSVILDTKIDVEKVIEKVLSVLTDPSDEVVGENPKVNMDSEYETILPIESTIELIGEPEIGEGITEKEILSCTDSSTTTVHIQTYVEKCIEEVSLALINSSDKEVEKMNVNIDQENETLLQIDISTGKDKEELYKLIETLLPIKSTVESIKETQVEDRTEPEITSYFESSTEMIDDQNHTKKIVDQEPPVAINSSGEVLEGNTNVDIDTENETLLPIGSTMELTVEPKVEENITVTAITSCTDSSAISDDVQTDVENIIDDEFPSPIHSLGVLVHEYMNMNISTENEIRLPFESTIGYIEEPKVVDDITEIEITSSTGLLTKIINPQNHAEKKIDEALINYLDEVVGKHTKVNNSTENNTLLSIETTKELTVEPKVEENITLTAITSCTDSSTITVDAQTDVENVMEDESSAPMKSLNEVKQEKTNMNINTKYETLLQIDTSTSSVKEIKEINEVIETFLPIKSTMESIEVSKNLEDINEIEKTSFTDPTILTKDVQTDVDKEIKKKSSAAIHFLGELLEGNTKVNNDTETSLLLSIESTEELAVEPIVEQNKTETAITSCTGSSTATVDVQKDCEKFIEEVSPAPINSSDEVVRGSTNVNIDTVNETLLQIDTFTTAVEAVIKENIVEKEYSTPTVSSILVVEKQIDVIIEPKTENLLPIETNTTFVDEPNLVGCVSENEHAAFIDSSITSVKQQIKIDTETEIEKLLLIDNLTESVKEQIVEKITENKSPTVFDSLAEVVGERSIVNIDTNNQTQLPINTSSTVVDNLIVKDIIENETQTPIYCLVDVVEEEQTKVDIETNNENITPIDIFTTSIEEQLNVKYLYENENMVHIDNLTTMIKNETKIDIETENKTLLSIENTSIEEQMDEVDTIIQNNLLVNFSAATELKGSEIVTDTETGTSTSIGTFNKTVDRQTVKENFKEIESTIRNATSTTFEEEQKAVEHITVIENVPSTCTSTASVEEEIQVEEVIKTESATFINYSTTLDVASLEEPKVNKNETTAMISSVTVVEEQVEVVTAEVVIDTSKECLDKTGLEKGIHNKTPTPIDILVAVTEKQIDLGKVAKNEIPLLVDTSTEYIEKPTYIEKVTENESITLIACEALPKIETNEFEAESENKTSIPVNNSALIAIAQTEIEYLTETTLPNDEIMYRNTKTNLIDKEIKTENSDNPNNSYLKFGETSKVHLLENEDTLQRKSYGIQKLEMSVQHMKTSDEDYCEETCIQLEQTENISKMDEVNVDGENKTIFDDKLYTVNKSDLNAILCASSLEEALTLLDSKIKFKFKHKKSSSRINPEYIPKIQTSDSKSNGVNPNFSDAREFFKEIEKKSKN